MKTVRKTLLSEIYFFLTLPALLWQLFFLVTPIIIILAYSLITPTSFFSLANYRHVISSVHFTIIFHSLLLAVCTAVTCLVIAYPVAYFLALRVKRGKNQLLFLLILPFWVNFLVHIYAWLFLLERNGLFNKILMYVGFISEPLLFSYSFGAMYLVMVYCYLPFMIMPLFSTLEKIDKRLLEASADLGATRWQTFWRITVPLSLPGIRTGISLVLVPAFGEFVIPALLGGSKYMLVGSTISYYFLIARNNGYGAAFTYVSALTLIGVVSLFFVMRFVYRIARGVWS